MVSIPFKRERLSEHSMAWVGKNSFLFQFPSNGKGFPNEGDSNYKVANAASFNSLQTGKAFRTYYSSLFCRRRSGVSIPFKRERLSEQSKKEFRMDVIKLCFNSLQTGKAFRTN